MFHINQETSSPILTQRPFPKGLELDIDFFCFLTKTSIRKEHSKILCPNKTKEKILRNVEDSRSTRHPSHMPLDFSEDNSLLLICRGEARFEDI